jgi:hypothetical protein
MITVEKDPYTSIVVKDEDGELVTISEGDNVKFCTDSGEVKQGKLIKFNGKKEKLKLQIMPVGSECEEIWSVMVMSEGSLVLNRVTE